MGTCLALEIVTGVVALGAATFGTVWAADRLRPEDAAPVRVASSSSPAVQRDVRTPIDAGAPAPVPAPVAIAPPAPAPVALAPPPADMATWAFAGDPDAPLLDPLKTGKVTRVKFNRGGSSLSLRLDFDNGARAAFKPEQTFLQSNPRREIAAYRIDRLLGIGRVPPAIGRSFTLAELEAAVDPSQRGQAARLRTQAVARRGLVKGEASWWIPVLGDTFIGKNRVDSTDAIVQWRRWLKVGATIPEDRRELCAQLSTMTAFDFLIDNIDRWTGNNAKTSKDGKILYFMDNTMAFSRNKKANHKNHLYLERVQTFSRRLVARLRTLDDVEIHAALEPDAAPFDRLLTDAEIAAMLGRRDVLLAYIDDLIARHGEAKVLVFP